MPEASLPRSTRASRDGESRPGEVREAKELRAEHAETEPSGYGSSHEGVDRCNSRGYFKLILLNIKIPVIWWKLEKKDMFAISDCDLRIHFSRENLSSNTPPSRLNQYGHSFNMNFKLKLLNCFVPDLKFTRSLDDLFSRWCGSPFSSVFPLASIPHFFAFIQ